MKIVFRITVVGLVFIIGTIGLVRLQEWANKVDEDTENTIYHD